MRNTRIFIAWAITALSAGPVTAHAQARVQVQGRDTLALGRVTVGGRLHTQLATSSVEGTTSDVFIRRARVTVDVGAVCPAGGSCFLDARVMPDFAGGRTALQDAYVRLNVDRALRVSFGQFKRAFSTFELSSSTDLPIVERDGRVDGVDLCAGVGGVCTFSRLTERLGFDGRDVGLRLEGRLGGRASYLGTVTNGEGLNTPDVNEGKSFSGRLDLEAVDGVAVGLFGGVHDHPGAVQDDTDYGVAFGADVELGGWRDGFHLLGALSTGDNWRAGPDARFVAAQALISYYVPLDRPRLAGVEPLFRVGWADPDDDARDDAGLVLTPGVMVYVLGKNAVSANVDVYAPSGAADTEWSLKLQTYVYF